MAATQPRKMRTAVFPERTCRDRVPGQFQDYSCEVVESHQGPCASYSVQESVKHRVQWERRNPGKVEPDARQVWADVKGAPA